MWCVCGRRRYERLTAFDQWVECSPQISPPWSLNIFLRLLSTSIVSTDRLQRWLRFSLSDPRPSQLLQLSQELCLLIMDHLDYTSAVCLKLSCKRFYQAIPMPRPPPSFTHTQRLAVLRLVPPPVRHGVMPFILCEDCQKYHGPDWPVMGSLWTASIKTRSGYQIIESSSKLSCSGRRPKRDEVGPMPIKPCKSCWALGQMNGARMSCACGRWQYVLISLENRGESTVFGWRRWR
jgi:hypothetical protein